MFKLQFETDNAVFDKDRPAECRRILKLIASRVYPGLTDGIIHDANGNRIGAWALDIEESV